jgi:hypothetical protein
MEFDIESLTLGECLAAEEASGRDLASLIGSTSGRLLLAVFVDRLRSSGETPSWQELTHLRLLDTSRGRSPSRRASPSVRSSV